MGRAVLSIAAVGCAAAAYLLFFLRRPVDRTEDDELLLLADNACSAAEDKMSHLSEELERSLSEVSNDVGGPIVDILPSDAEPESPVYRGAPSRHMRRSSLMEGSQSEGMSTGRRGEGVEPVKVSRIRSTDVKQAVNQVLLPKLIQHQNRIVKLKREFRIGAIDRTQMRSALNESAREFDEKYAAAIRTATKIAEETGALPPLRRLASSDESWAMVESLRTELSRPNGLGAASSAETQPTPEISEAQSAAMSAAPSGRNEADRSKRCTIS